MNLLIYKQGRQGTLILCVVDSGIRNVKTNWIRMGEAITTTYDIDYLVLTKWLPLNNNFYMDLYDLFL